MYPLKAVLVGCNEETEQAIRRELTTQGVTIEGIYPDVKTVGAKLSASQEGKWLFIFQVESGSQLRLLERLNDVFVGRPIVAVISSPGDGSLVLPAMRAGASQVVTLPLDPEDFQQALLRVARQFGYPTSSKVIAVSGVSEGCGATTVAINLASEIASQHQLPTVLVELSLRLGRLASYLNIEPRLTTPELISEIDRLDIDAVRKALTAVNSSFQVLAGPFKGIASIPVVPAHVVRLVDYVRRLCQVTILDMPYTYDDLYFQTIVTADQIVLIGDQNIPSIHAMKMVKDTLIKTEGVGALYLVINRYDPRHATCTLKHLLVLLLVPRLFTVQQAARCAGSAINEGTVFREIDPRCPALGDIDNLANVLLGLPEQPHSHWHIPAFLRRLMPALGHPQT